MPASSLIFVALSGCNEEETLSTAALRGEEVFETHCSVCHDMSEAKQAPVLGGLIGLRTGQGAFEYSEAFRQVDFVWTAEKLDAFLQNPRETIPENQMAFYGLEDAGQRSDLIAYIAEFKAD